MTIAVYVRGGMLELVHPQTDPASGRSDDRHLDTLSLEEVEQLVADLNKVLPKLREEKRKGKLRALESARECLAKSESDVVALKRRVKELERDTA